MANNSDDGPFTSLVVRGGGCLSVVDPRILTCKEGFDSVEIKGDTLIATTRNPSWTAPGEVSTHRRRNPSFKKDGFAKVNVIEIKGFRESTRIVVNDEDLTDQVRKILAKKGKIRPPFDNVDPSDVTRVLTRPLKLNSIIVEDDALLFLDTHDAIQSGTLVLRTQVYGLAHVVLDKRVERINVIKDSASSIHIEAKEGAGALHILHAVGGKALVAKGRFDKVDIFASGYSHIEVDRCASHAHVSAIDVSSVSFTYEEGCEVKVSISELALVEQNVFKQ